MRRRALGALLILMMALGSILLWIGIPLGVLWGASQIFTSQQPTMTVYVGVAVAIPTLMVICARGLGVLDYYYAELTGARRDAVYRPKFMRSLRGARRSDHRATVLDVVMAISVALALLAMLVWVIGFSGSPLPSS